MTMMLKYSGRAGSSHLMLQLAAAVLAIALFTAGSPGLARATQPTIDACAGSDGGILLPPGFCATVFADNLGHARHLVVAPDGVVYVNTWSGVYYRTKPPQGGFVIALKDTKG